MGDWMSDLLKEYFLDKEKEFWDHYDDPVEMEDDEDV